MMISPIGSKMSNLQSDCEQSSSGFVDDILNQKRSELIGYLANTSMEFLKRLYDGTPIFKRYGREELAIHLHLNAPLPICLRWRRKTFRPLELLLDFDQAAMPVPVGESL